MASPPRPLGGALAVAPAAVRRSCERVPGFMGGGAVSHGPRNWRCHARPRAAAASGVPVIADCLLLPRPWQYRKS